MLQSHLDTIAGNWKLPAKHGHLPYGKLEKILAKKSHPSRPALVWKNLWFSSSMRKTVSICSNSSAVNAPLSLNPSLLPRIERLVQVATSTRRHTRSFGRRCKRRRSAANSNNGRSLFSQRGSAESQNVLRSPTERVARWFEPANDRYRETGMTALGRFLPVDDGQLTDSTQRRSFGWRAIIIDVP
jgi:hypothetical protein